MERTRRGWSFWIGVARSWTDYIDGSGRLSRWGFGGNVGGVCEVTFYKAGVQAQLVEDDFSRVAESQKKGDSRCDR